MFTPTSDFASFQRSTIFLFRDPKGFVKSSLSVSLFFCLFGNYFEANVERKELGCSFWKLVIYPGNCSLVVGKDSVNILHGYVSYDTSKIDGLKHTCRVSLLMVSRKPSLKIQWYFIIE